MTRGYRAADRDVGCTGLPRRRLRDGRDRVDHPEDRQQARRDSNGVRKRETLYGEFIGECAKLLFDAFGHTLDKPETLLAVYALINRIRLSASAAVLVEAEHLLRRITEQYFSKNLSVDEMRELAHAEGTDPLRAFGEACRAELKAMRARM